MSPIQENIERGWVEIEGFPGYRVTIDGVLTSGRSQGDRNKIIKLGKWKTRRTYLNSDGYVVAGLMMDNGKIKTVKIHRLVAMHFINNPENKPQVNHMDGNKENNLCSNLEWCTPRENVLHSVDNKLRSRQILIIEQVLDIRNRAINGALNKVLAREFGVSETTISDIKRRRSWKHV